MTNHTESSHVNHVSIAILVFILGSLVGYGIGSAYQSEAAATDQLDQTVVNSFPIKKKVPAKVVPKTTTTTSTSGTIIP